MIAVNSLAFRKFYYALDRIAGLPATTHILRRTSDAHNNAHRLLAAGGKDYTQLGNLAEISSTDQHNLKNS